MSWKCPICGTQQEKEYVADIVWKVPMPGPASYKIVKCINCEIELSDPIPSEEVLQEFYSDYKPTQILDQPYRAKELIDLQESIVEWLFNKIDKNRNSVKILDYGYGAGCFLIKAASMGFNCTGLDYGKKNLEQLKEISSQKNVNLNLYDYDEGGIGQLHDKKFDCITLFQVIEHLRDPSKVIKELREKLSEDGLIYIECPNQDGLFFRLKNLIRSAINRKFMWGSVSPPHHLFGYNEKSLEELLNICGFDLIEIGDYRVADGLRAPETRFWYPSLSGWLMNKKWWTPYHTGKMVLRILDFFASKYLKRGAGLYALARKRV